MFDLGSAALAGILAGLGALIVAAFIGWLAPERVRLHVITALGTAIGGAPRVPMGLALYAAVSVVLGVIYAAITGPTGQAGSTAAGAIIGAVQWLITGVAVGRWATRHPLVRDGGVPSPGYFALAYSRTTAVTVLLLTLLFGVLVSWLYGGLSGAFCPGCEFL